MTVFPEENRNFLDRRRKRISSHIRSLHNQYIVYVGGADDCIDGTGGEVDEADDLAR